MLLKSARIQSLDVSICTSFHVPITKWLYQITTVWWLNFVFNRITGNEIKVFFFFPNSWKTLPPTSVWLLHQENVECKQMVSARTELHDMRDEWKERSGGNRALLCVQMRNIVCNVSLSRSQIPFNPGGTSGYPLT
jgi:hypothetical protein